jgi:hypothetical protein
MTTAPGLASVLALTADPFAFPPPLDAYPDTGGGILSTLAERAAQEPFNAVVTALFVCALIHIFLAPKIMGLSHKVQYLAASRPQLMVPARLLHFFGEVEAVFGLWVLPLVLLLVVFKGWDTAHTYLTTKVHYTEPLFVVVIMIIASSKPVLAFTSSCLGRVGGLSLTRWWFALLTLGPVLGSLITEPAAMTICALLLAKRFYDLEPGLPLRYATLGLLFVNISVGGTFTHFAAPPVLMIAQKWGFDTPFMAANFGLPALAGIVVSNVLYYLVFRREFVMLENKARTLWLYERDENDADSKVPGWVTAVHLGFLAWTVFTGHDPALFVGGLLFYLGFCTVTKEFQEPLQLKTPILVGFFLAGLVIHGGLQAWWIEPVLSSLSATPLLLSATALTAFNDNAAITYLASLVPSLTDPQKMAIVAGAMAGGGLTVIANAPNPAGQSILDRYFRNGVAAGSLVLAAAIPTVIQLIALGLLK